MQATACRRTVAQRFMAIWVNIRIRGGMVWFRHVLMLVVLLLMLNGGIVSTASLVLRQWRVRQTGRGRRVKGRRSGVLVGLCVVLVAIGLMVLVARMLMRMRMVLMIVSEWIRLCCAVCCVCPLIGMQVILAQLQNRGGTVCIDGLLLLLLLMCLTGGPPPRWRWRRNL